MLKTGKFAALAILGLLAVNPAFAKDKSTTKANDITISQARIDLRIKAAAAQGQPDTPELRKAIREDMINLELLTREAKKAGIDKNPEVIEQSKLAQQSVLVGAYVQSYAKSHPITEEHLTQEYERAKATLGKEEYNASHILVDSEDEAKAIIVQLNNEGSFEAIAKTKSKDAGSADKGGSLGWTVPGNFVPPFANALLSLKKGEYTKQPVKTQFGWHIVKLDDVRSLVMPSYEELKPQMLQRLQQQIIQDLIADLRSKAKIE